MIVGIVALDRDDRPVLVVETMAKVLEVGTESSPYLKYLLEF